MMLSLALAAAAAAAQAPTVTIDAWKVPYENSRPRDPDVAADGRVWFVGQAGHYIAVFDPKSASFTKHDLADRAGPHNLVLSRDGIVWYTGNLEGYIGRLDPRDFGKDGAVRKYPMPDPAVDDPHTLAWAPDGNLWFTAQKGNVLGHLDVKTGAVRLWPASKPDSRPYGIVVDAQGRPWANLLGTDKLATVDPESYVYEEIALRREAARTRRIALDRNGTVWAVDYAGGHLVRYDPKTRAMQEWLAPAGDTALPYAMGVDDRGRFWFAESGPQPNRLVCFDSAQEKFVADVEVPNANGAIRHMVFDPKTRAFWFGTDTNYLMRATIAD
jgi:virginiamycin B lyase